MAYTVEDVRRIRKAGKVASLIGVEGGHSIGESLSVLRNFYRLGVRYMTLTHSANTSWADSGTDEPKNKGLSQVRRGRGPRDEPAGMLVDLSHVSPDTMRHALRISSAPVIFSHSSAFGVAEHPRNVPDDVLKLTAKNGGVVMVNFYSGFIVPEAARQRLTMFEVARKLKGGIPRRARVQAGDPGVGKGQPDPGRLDPHAGRSHRPHRQSRGHRPRRIGLRLRRRSDAAGPTRRRLALPLHYAGIVEPRLRTWGRAQGVGRELHARVRGGRAGEGEVKDD